MKKYAHTSLVAAAFALISLVPSALAQTDTQTSVQNVVNAIAADKSKVVEIVSEESENNPQAVGEIVKAAIMATEASKELVALIVEAAARAVPDSVTLIVQFALSVAPDAIVEINAAIANVQANPTPPQSNPLDFPNEGGEGGQGGQGGQGGEGSQGGDGGNSLLPNIVIDTPVVNDPPVVTNPNPPVG